MRRALLLAMQAMNHTDEYHFWPTSLLALPSVYLAIADAHFAGSLPQPASNVLTDRFSHHETSADWNIDITFAQKETTRGVA